jgi:carboxymethylenebutenolidase
MERKKASDFPQELLNLFDGYVHGGISRRQFGERLLGLGASDDMRRV